MSSNRSGRLTGAARTLAVLGTIAAGAACSDKAFPPTDNGGGGVPNANISLTNSASTAVQAALVVFNADTNTTAPRTASVSVTGSGIAAPSADVATAGGAVLTRSAVASGVSLAGAGDAFAGREPVMSDLAVMRRLHAAAQRELLPRVAGARVAYQTARATGNYATFQRVGTQAVATTTGGISRSVGVTTGPVRAAVPSVGDVIQLNVRVPGGASSDNVGTGNGTCDPPNLVSARIAAVSTRAIVAVDTRNPATGVNDAYYASVATAFDTLVYPVDVRHFGAPVDIDNNGRAILFYTRAVNGLTPANSQSYVGGFFFSRDLFPTTTNANFEGCAGSNAAELFYLLAPDPTGAINGNARDTAFIRRVSIGTAAHEFQHLINAERRLYVLNTDNFDEDVWLNEGLSHIAEELNFYRSAGLSAAATPGSSPRARLTATSIRSASNGITALNSFGFQNLTRFSLYLAATESYGPYSNNDSLETRGATWSFLRYAADRSGGADSAFFYSLVNSTRLGLDNLRAVVAARGGSSASTPLADWFRDWSVANYADGLAANLPSQYTQPSWVFRSVLTGFQTTGGGFINGGVYPLRTRTLASGVAQTASLASGEAAYFVFSIPAGSTASLAVAAGGSTNLSSTGVRASLVQVSGASAGTVSTY